MSAAVSTTAWAGWGRRRASTGEGWDAPLRWSAPAIVAGPVSTAFGAGARSISYHDGLAIHRRPGTGGAGCRPVCTAEAVWLGSNRQFGRVPGSARLSLVSPDVGSACKVTPAPPHVQKVPFQFIAILSTYHKEVQHCSYISRGHMFSSKLPSC